MADQASTQELSHGASSFAPQGVPQIVGINRRGLWTLYSKEVRRFFKVQVQTVWAPAFTTLLYLMIFSLAIAGRNRLVMGVSFPTFVAPGLIAMAIMNASFANSSFHFLSGKLQGTIVDYLMPPLSPGELVTGLMGAAVTRAALNGMAVALACSLWPGVSLAMAHPGAVLWFGLMGSLLLGFIGLLSSLWAEKFEHNAAITNFVVTPLTMLSGTFYASSALSPTLQAISRANPFHYVISGFRYGFLGQSDMGPTSHVIYGALGLGLLNLGLGVLTYILVKRGWRLRA